MHYRRILLKLSGEALGCSREGSTEKTIDLKIVSAIAQDIATVVKSGVQVGIVIGGGNWFRGVQAKNIGVDRITADQIGMLATHMNALVLRDALTDKKLDARILSSSTIASLVEPFEHIKARHYLEDGKVVIFAGGTGHPFVSTDSAASLRALEIQADILLKATAVDGIYSADPAKDINATLYQKISYEEVIQHELQVMDLSAFIQCRDHQLPIRVFNINAPGSLVDVVQGKSIGTLVSKEGVV